MPTLKFKIRRSKKSKAKEAKHASLTELEASPEKSSSKTDKSKSQTPQQKDLQRRRFSHTGVTSSRGADSPTEAGVRKSASCSGITPTPVEGSRERRLSDIAQLNKYIAYLKQNADDNSLPFLPNRLCCAQVLRQVLWRQERDYISDVLHGRRPARRGSLPVTPSSTTSSSSSSHSHSSSSTARAITRRKSQADAMLADSHHQTELARHLHALYLSSQQKAPRYLNKKDTEECQRARLVSVSSENLARKSSQYSCGEESYDEDTHPDDDDDDDNDVSRHENSDQEDWLDSCRHKSGSASRRHSMALYPQNLEIY